MDTTFDVCVIFVLYLTDDGKEEEEEEEKKLEKVGGRSQIFILLLPTIKFSIKFFSFLFFLSC